MEDKLLVEVFGVLETVQRASTKQYYQP